METVCPKCGAESRGESCARCGLVFAKYDPDLLDAAVPEDLKAMWRQVTATWDDTELHHRFIEEAMSRSHGDYAARCYRLSGEDPAARRGAEEVGEKMASMASGLVAALTAGRDERPHRDRNPLVLAVAVLFFLLVLGAMALLLPKSLSQ